MDFKENIQHGTKEFPLMVYTGGFAPYHWHSEYEIVYIKKGQILYHTENTIIPVSQGEALICASGVLHAVMLDEKEAAEYDVVVFDLNFILKDIDICNQFFTGEYIINSKFSSLNKEEADITDSIKEIFHSFYKKEFGYELELKMLLTKIFSCIFKYGFYTYTPASSLERAMKQSLMTVIHHIHTYYHQKITLQSLADLVGYSISHFGRFFKTSMGQTPSEYIISYRLYKSCELLRGSNKSVLETAMECGFSNVNYYIKIFKEKYGYTPYQYRLRG